MRHNGGKIFTYIFFTREERCRIYSNSVRKICRQSTGSQVFCRSVYFPGFSEKRSPLWAAVTLYTRYTTFIFIRNVSKKGKECCFLFVSMDSYENVSKMTKPIWNSAVRLRYVEESSRLFVQRTKWKFFKSFRCATLYKVRLGNLSCVFFSRSSFSNCSPFDGVRNRRWEDSQGFF